MVKIKKIPRNKVFNIERTTKLAVLIHGMWLPKSQIEIKEGAGYIKVKDWFYEKNKSEMDEVCLTPWYYEQFSDIPQQDKLPEGVYGRLEAIDELEDEQLKSHFFLVYSLYRYKTGIEMEFVESSHKFQIKDTLETILGKDIEINNDKDLGKYLKEEWLKVKGKVMLGE